MCTACDVVRYLILTIRDNKPFEFMGKMQWGSQINNISIEIFNGFASLCHIFWVSKP
jgi:hypothetical protein